MRKKADLQCSENSSADDNVDSEQPSENIDGGDDDGDVSDFEGLAEFSSVLGANYDDSLNRRAASERQGVLSGIPQGVVVDDSSVFREGLASGTRRGFELPSGPAMVPEMRVPSVAAIIPSVDYPSESAAAATYSGSALQRSSTPGQGSILREARARRRPLAPTSARRKRYSSDTGEDARVSLYRKVSDVLDDHHRTKRVRESPDMMRALTLQRKAERELELRKEELRSSSDIALREQALRRGQQAKAYLEMDVSDAVKSSLLRSIVILPMRCLVVHRGEAREFP
jgi:hypothetical protein